jgi:flagellar hook-basal body complex protein FliE
MSSPIDMASLRISEGLDRLATDGPGGKDKKDSGFADVLKDLVHQADDLQKDSHAKLAGFESGQVEDVHDVMIAMTKADLSFRMMLEVRNKLVEAYQEVMRIQV